MEMNNYNGVTDVKEKINFPLGLIGAVIGAAIGGVIWYAIGRLGYVASIAGFLTAFFSIELFKRLAKGIDRKAIIIGVTLSFIAIFIAQWVVTIAVMRDELGSLISHMSFQELNDFFIKLLQTEPEVRTAFIKDLLFGFGFAILGCFSYIRTLNKKIKQKNQPTNQSNQVDNANIYNNPELYNTPQEKDDTEI